MIKLHQLAPGAPYDDTTMTAESSEMPKKRQMLDEEHRNRCFLCYSRVTRRVLVLNRVEPRRFAQVLSTLKLTPSSDCSSATPFNSGMAHPCHMHRPECHYRP